MATPARGMSGIPGKHEHTISLLANKLELPWDEVAAVYLAQLDYIGASARVHCYLGLLAANRARSILRGSRRSNAIVNGTSSTRNTG